VRSVEGGEVRIRGAPGPERSRRMVRLGPAAVLAFVVGLGFAVGLAAAQEIRVEREEGGLVLSRVPDVLSADEVREHLESGLTSTFSVRAVVRDGRRRVEATGGLAVRYDLWEETYQVASRGLFGDRRWEIASFDELVRWWRTPLARLPTGDLEPSREWQVRIDVDLIPFSSAEERDAQRWVSESLQAAQGATDSVSGAAEEGPDPLSNVLNLLLATSVRRRPVATWRWTAAVPPEPPARGSPHRAPGNEP
jgi:hypothetical protein